MDPSLKDDEQVSVAEADTAPDGADGDESRSATAPLMAPAAESSSSFVQSGPSPHLTLFSSLALVLSLQIGSGIFSAPSQVSLHVPSPAIGVSVWLVAGALVWTGAATFIELGLRIPRNGGVQEYLAVAWGEGLGFIFTMVYWLIAKPAANGVIAGVGAEYICGAFLAGEQDRGEVKISGWIVKPVALLGLWTITTVNCMGAQTGPKVANGFLVLKLGIVLSIVGTGFTLLVMGKAQATSEASFGWFKIESFKELNGDATDISPLQWAGEYLIAIFGALWCYGGWETIGFVAGEIKDPKRDLPRVINTSMATVMVVFALLNGSFYAVLSMQVIRDRLAVAVEFGAAVFGSLGVIAYSALVSISAWGALNANTYAAGRLAAAASDRGYFPSVLGKNTHYDSEKDESEYYGDKLARLPRPLLSGVKSFAKVTANLRLLQEVPIYAMIANSVLASLFILMGTFYGLVTFIGTIEYIFFFLAAAGLRNIRRSSLVPHTYEQPYMTWNSNPIVFCVLSAVLVLRGLLQDPLSAIFILLSLLTTWWLWRRRKNNFEEAKHQDGNVVALETLN